MFTFLTSLALLAAPAAADRARPCEFNLPIAGSAGFANGQAARQTNANTYSAAAFYERLVGESKRGVAAGAEANVTFNAATIPTFCDDFDSFNSVYWSNKNKYPVYGEPLDLYALNAAFAVGHPNFGVFYSASVTQSVLGYRYIAPITLIMNVYPIAFAPLIGVWQRGDGVASYALDWIGGGYVSTRWGGARVGYTGARGLYGSVDERLIGLFGSVGLADLGGGGGGSPWSFLTAGLQDFTVARLGAGERAYRIAGATSLFLRDLPFGETIADAASDVLIPAAGDPGADPVSDGARLQVVRLRQRGISERFDVELGYTVRPERRISEAMFAYHTPGYHPMQLTANNRDLGGGFLIKIGLTNLPPRYDLGVEGGNLLTARAEYREGAMFAMLLFNDPEQLALYPFATNTLTLRVGVSAGMDKL